MKAASSGLSTGLPARWPQIDGIGRNVFDGEIEIGLTRHHGLVGGDRTQCFIEVATVKLVAADVGVLPGPQRLSDLMRRAAHRSGMADRAWQAARPDQVL